MKLLLNILICAAFSPIISTYCMDNDNNKVAFPRLLVRESRALLDASVRECVIDALEGTAQSPRTAARSLLEESRSMRALLPVNKIYEEPKTALLLAEKNIAHQLELLSECNNNQEILDHLNNLLSEARIAILVAQSALEDNQQSTASYNNAGNYSPTVSRHNVASLYNTTDHAQRNSPRDDQQSNESKLQQATARLEKSMAEVNEILSRHQQSSESSRGSTLGDELSKRFAKTPQHAAFETCLSFYKEDPTFLSKANLEGYPLLHQGLYKLCTNPHPMDYIIFASLLGYGVDRTVLNDQGQTLLDVALSSGNDMLVQLLTAEQVTKETVVTLACEHGKYELMPYLLEN